MERRKGRAMRIFRVARELYVIDGSSYDGERGKRYFTD